MRLHRKLTDDKRRQIIEARAEGTPATVLACRFGVSPRTIYNKLRCAEGARPARTRTISTRVSVRELGGFRAALARRGTTELPAALRCLMDVADVLMRPADQAVIDQMHAWGADIATHGAAINHIARKAERGKAARTPDSVHRRRHDHDPRLRGGFITFAEEFRVLCEAQKAAMTREVDKALNGLEGFVAQIG